MWSSCCLHIQHYGRLPIKRAHISVPVIPLKLLDLTDRPWPFQAALRELFALWPAWHNAGCVCLLGWAVISIWLFKTTQKKICNHFVRVSIWSFQLFFINKGPFLSWILLLWIRIFFNMQSIGFNLFVNIICFMGNITCYYCKGSIHVVVWGGV